MHCGISGVSLHYDYIYTPIHEPIYYYIPTLVYVNAN